jgi:hypothetical protein
MNTLMMFVCGCVVDSDSFYRAEHDGIIECPFCKITFTIDDLEEWLTVNAIEIRILLMNAIHKTLPLIQYKNQTFEVTEICDCGYPIVRKMKGSRRRHHLRVPEKATVRLFD